MQTSAAVQAAAPLMTITALDYGSDRVEGGDIVLVSSGGKYLLMDTGNYDDTNKVILYLKSHRIKKLSLYLSHWHEDHFYYLWHIMDNPYFTVERLYLPSTTPIRKCAAGRYRNRFWYEFAVRCWKGIPSAGLYGAKEICKKAKKEKIPVTFLKKGSSFQIGNAAAEVLWSSGANTFSSGFWEYINDRSLVTKITAGDMSFLTAGDISRKTLRKMIKKGIDLRADLYKLSHHGTDSDTASIIRKIHPACAFYCDSTEKKGEIRLSKNRRKIAAKTKLYSVRYNGNLTFRLYGKQSAVPVKVTVQRRRAV
ncbi:MAG: MBL fold metallo-hydrolase [Eubacterium sp.]|nr:MBL fold metallo-hydrolase [Eubacterium sp.]